jgi:hypothetical protein
MHEQQHMHIGVGVRIGRITRLWVMGRVAATQNMLVKLVMGGGHQK